MSLSDTRVSHTRSAPVTLDRAAVTSARSVAVGMSSPYRPGPQHTVTMARATPCVRGGVLHVNGRPAIAVGDVA